MYVQAYGGSDAVGTGEKDSPVATLTKALTVAKDKYNASPDAYKKTQIIVGDGIYDAKGTVYVSASNTAFGEDGLVIKAEDGAKPTFVGGTTYNINEATKVTDEAILSRLHSDNAKQNLYELDLTTKIALNKIPAVNYPGAYNLNSMLSQVGLENPPTRTCEAIFDNNLMTVARYPNSGYAYAGEVVDAGIEACYMLDSYDGTENDLDVTEENLLKGFEIKSDYENLSKWATADQALIFGYFMYDWATQTVPLKVINAENGTLRSKYPSYYGIKEGKRYYVYNLLEEIDLPGEYFIDRKTGKMYFYMPSNATETSTISITNNSGSLMSISAENVTVDGLTFTGSKSSGVYLGGNNNVVKNCEISNTASCGVDLQGTNNTVDNCFIHDTNVGVLLSGGNTNSLTPGNNKVQNCEITRYSRISKTYCAAVEVYGVGNIVTHNEIHDGEHIALRYQGLNHTLSYNEIYDVCKEVDDAGAIYVGRKWTDRGNKIISNYFHDINPNIDTTSAGQNPVAGIFLDDHYAGAYIEGNVFANIFGDGIRGNGGREHTITNNVFVNCTLRGTAMKDSNPANAYETQVEGLSKVPYQSDVWKEAFPALYNILNNKPSYPVDHVYTNNLAVNCGQAGYIYGSLATQYATDISNNITTNEDPGFKDMANGNYTITSDTMKALIPEFKTIEFEKMGRQ